MLPLILILPIVVTFSTPTPALVNYPLQVLLGLETMQPLDVAGEK